MKAIGKKWIKNMVKFLRETVYENKECLKFIVGVFVVFSMRFWFMPNIFIWMIWMFVSLIFIEVKGLLKISQISFRIMLLLIVLCLFDQRINTFLFTFIFVFIVILCHYKQSFLIIREQLLDDISRYNKKTMLFFVKKFLPHLYFKNSFMIYDVQSLNGKLYSYTLALIIMFFFQNCHDLLFINSYLYVDFFSQYIYKIVEISNAMLQLAAISIILGIFAIANTTIHGINAYLVMDWELRDYSERLVFILFSLSYVFYGVFELMHLNYIKIFFIYFCMIMLYKAIKSMFSFISISEFCFTIKERIIIEINNISKLYDEYNDNFINSLPEYLIQMNNPLFYLPLNLIIENSYDFREMIPIINRILSEYLFSSLSYAKLNQDSYIVGIVYVFKEFIMSYIKKCYNNSTLSNQEMIENITIISNQINTFYNDTYETFINSLNRYQERTNGYINHINNILNDKKTKKYKLKYYLYKYEKESLYNPMPEIEVFVFVVYYLYLKIILFYYSNDGYNDFYLEVLRQVLLVLNNNYEKSMSDCFNVNYYHEIIALSEKIDDQVLEVFSKYEISCRVMDSNKKNNIVRVCKKTIDVFFNQ